MFPACFRPITVPDTAQIARPGFCEYRPVPQSDLDVWAVLASLSLVGAAIGVSAWRGLGLERTIGWAATRAAVQLLLAGFVLALAFDSQFLTWVWVLAMVTYSAEVVRQRSSGGHKIRAIALLAIGGSTGVSLLVVCGLGVLDFTPVGLIVTAGITIGNTMPATVLAVTRTNEYLVTGRGELEAMLALGFSRGQVAKVVGAIVARSALIPQIERTKVVGLIALPGAMTGLLLAGVEPLQAVLIQLVVMYLVLGSVTTSVLFVTMASAGSLMTADLRVRERAE